MGRDGTYSVKTGKHTSYGWLSFKDAVGRLSELLEMTEEQVQSMMDNFEGDSK